jgi:hypothetical protein
VETNNLIWLLRLCLAKTLARKFKLRSARQAFKKFGPLLKDPITDLKFLLPLNAINQYNKTAPPTKTHTWHSRLTKTNLFLNCLLCGSICTILLKIRTGNSTFNEIKGGTLRKQIPLCQYHHTLYHKGELLGYEMKTISKYSSNLSSILKSKTEVNE